MKHKHPVNFDLSLQLKNPNKILLCDAVKPIVRKQVLWHGEQEQIKLYAALLMASPEDQHGSLPAFHDSNAEAFLWCND